MNKYIKQEFEFIIKKSFSIAEVCRYYNIRSVGGNYKTIKKYVKIFNVDISHFTGQGWNTGTKFKPFSKTILLKDILIENSTYTSTALLKKRLIKKGLKENKCEKCGLTNWNDKELIMHMDHINGNNLDHRLENLRILCPNCHSQTDTYCSKNRNKSTSSELKNKIYKKYKINESIKKVKELNYCECGKEITKKAKMCIDCYSLKQRKVKDRPDKETLLKMVKEISYVKVGKKFGVSDNTIRKWLK